MKFKNLGELKQNENNKEYWESGEVEIPYFDNISLKFTIKLNQGDFIDDFEKAVDNFLKLSAEDRLKISQYVYKNYQEFTNSVGEGKSIDIFDEREVWKHVHPSEIIVSRRSKDKLVYVQIIAENDWEEEHGIQLVYKEGKELSRVSICDGHLTHSDAFGLSEKEDSIC